MKLLHFNLHFVMLTSQHHDFLHPDEGNWRSEFQDLPFKFAHCSHRFPLSLPDISLSLQIWPLELEVEENPKNKPAEGNLTEGGEVEPEAQGGEVEEHGAKDYKKELGNLWTWKVVAAVISRSNCFVYCEASMSKAMSLDEYTARGGIGQQVEDVEDRELRRFDIHLDGEETDERVRLFQDIARRFRLVFRQHLEWSSRDQNRINGLKMCLHDAVARIEAMKAENNTAADESLRQRNLNDELVERVSGISAAYVTACLERDANGDRAAKWKIGALSDAGVVAVLVVVIGYLIFRFPCAM